MLATTCNGDGRFERCREAAQRAIRLLELAGDSSAAWVARHTLAEIEFDAGRLDAHGSPDQPGHK